MFIRLATHWSLQLSTDQSANVGSGNQFRQMQQNWFFEKNSKKIWRLNYYTKFVPKLDWKMVKIRLKNGQNLKWELWSVNFRFQMKKVENYLFTGRCCRSPESRAPNFAESENDGKRSLLLPLSLSPPLCFDFIKFSIVSIFCSSVNAMKGLLYLPKACHWGTRWQENLLYCSLIFSKVLSILTWVCIEKWLEVAIPSDAVLSKTFWISCLVVAVMMVGSYRRSEFESRWGQKFFFQANPNYKGSKKWKKCLDQRKIFFKWNFLFSRFRKVLIPQRRISLKLAKFLLSISLNKKLQLVFTKIMA